MERNQRILQKPTINNTNEFLYYMPAEQTDLKRYTAENDEEGDHNPVLQTTTCTKRMELNGNRRTS